MSLERPSLTPTLLRMSHLFQQQGGFAQNILFGYGRESHNSILWNWCHTNFLEGLAAGLADFSNFKQDNVQFLRIYDFFPHNFL